MAGVNLVAGNPQLLGCQAGQVCLGELLRRAIRQDVVGDRGRGRSLLQKLCLFDRLDVSRLDDRKSIRIKRIRRNHADVPGAAVKVGLYLFVGEKPSMTGIDLIACKAQLLACQAHELFDFVLLFVTVRQDIPGDILRHGRGSPGFRRGLRLSCGETAKEYADCHGHHQDSRCQTFSSLFPSVNHFPTSNSTLQTSIFSLLYRKGKLLPFTSE